jgi:hypothetical protein
MAENEELTAIDYLIKPIVELQKHPDFSVHALRIVSAVSKMTTKELEQLQVDIILGRDARE